ncbi:MAG TPA: hypothetical protein PKC82_03775 [Chitinophagaceae bacterium]|nr:hypothetical protein [Chitinophagaceae bacterium]HNK61657.1 hypothetical protein [Chitinophagaceae bacterium]HNO55774.1 hypothetical protein [Chitinophagaceae bacterium]
MKIKKHAPIAFDLHKASASALAAARLFYFSPYADKSATAQNNYYAGLLT